jgi:hypothetical protein
MPCFGALHFIGANSCLFVTAGLWGIHQECEDANILYHRMRLTPSLGCALFPPALFAGVKKENE